MPQTRSSSAPVKISSNYLQSVIDGLQDELIVIDKDFRIVHANRAVLKRHHKRAGLIVGQYCYDVSHGLPELCHPPRPECPITHVWETAKPARATHLHLYGPEGQQKKRYIDVIASPIFDDDGKLIYVAEVLRDVTEAREMELKIQQAHQNLLALNSIAGEVSQSLDMDTVLTNALDRTLDVLKLAEGGIMLWDEDGKKLRYRVFRGLPASQVRALNFGKGEGIAGHAAQSGKAVIVEDIVTDNRAVFRDSLLEQGLHGFASVPIIYKDKTLGVLNVFSHEPRHFSEQDVSLLEGITSQVAMAVENARLHQEVRKQDQARGELLKELFSVQEDERKRIARELHDETTQSIVAMATSLEAIAASLPPNQKALKDKLKNLQTVAIGVLDETHRLIYELRPSMLDDFGLVAAVRAHIEHELAGKKADFKVSGRQKRLPPAVESGLFRVIQEAVNNIARHSEATASEVALTFGKASVGVRVADNGRGFDVKEAMGAPNRPRGLGLLGMKERISLLNGKIDIKSGPRKGGTEIVIEVPFVEGKKHEQD